MILDSISALTGQFNNDYECMRRLMAELQFSKYELSKRWEEFGAEISRGDALQIAKDALKTVRRQSIQKLLETNQQLMKDAESKGEDLTRYLNRHTELLNEKASVDAGDLR
jgi:hypothetical protein